MNEGTKDHVSVDCDTQLGMQWIGSGFEAINRWQFANDLTWVKGRHSIKVGYETPLWGTSNRC